MYNAAAAVLLNELLKGSISLAIAFRNAVLATSDPRSGDYARLATDDDLDGRRRGVPGGGGSDLGRAKYAGAKMLREVFSGDCWKLSIPACLYVIQNNVRSRRVSACRRPRANLVPLAHSCNSSPRPTSTCRRSR